MNSHLAQLKLKLPFIEQLDITCPPAKLAPEMQLELKSAEEEKIKNKDNVTDPLGRVLTDNDDFT